MDPVVVCGTFQRFSRIDRFVLLLLLFAKVVGNLLVAFPFNSLAFAFLLCFLLVRDFWWLNKIVLCIFYRAKSTFVLLGKVSIQIIVNDEPVLTIET